MTPNLGFQPFDLGLDFNELLRQSLAQGEASREQSRRQQDEISAATRASLDQLIGQAGEELSENSNSPPPEMMGPPKPSGDQNEESDFDKWMRVAITGALAGAPFGKGARGAAGGALANILNQALFIDR